MVGQPGINCCSILDNFRKKELGAYWLLLEHAPTCALFAGLLENDSPLTRSLDRNSLMVFSFDLSVTRSLQFYSTTLREE
jgi:hypothetical protein